MKKECVLVWTTIGNSADGRGMASILVAERLAACVNLLPAMESFYRWNDGVSNDHERQLIIKTTIDKVDALKTRVHELHDYELPEFIVMPIAGGSDAYLSWIRASTSG
jgi:periplasmic divalent cation tolerance protein